MTNKAQQGLATFLKKWRLLFLNLGGDPTRTLTRAYILALGLIAFLTISNHIITAHITDQQKESAEIAYHLGRQRTLMQQITLYASNYYRMGERLDYDFMMQSLWELEQGHEYLLATIDSRSLIHGYRSNVLHHIYHSPPFTLDEQVRQFSAMIKTYSEYPPQTQAIEDYDTKRKELIDQLKNKATNSLRPAMDAALEKYQTETLDKITRFYTIQLGGAIFILVVLLAEAAFIFQPLISRLKKYNIMMKRYALEDALTGLNNRRAFMKAAEIELKRAKRDKTAVTIALLDLDHFKKVNDTYGHDVGDKVLQHFAAIAKKAFRASDIVGRIGGEEFAIVLPRIDHEGGIRILQRLCDTVASTPCAYTGPDGESAALNYTISLGYIGPSMIDEQTIDELLAKADEALYEAKETGRNRVAGKQ